MPACDKKNKTKRKQQPLLTNYYVFQAAEITEYNKYEWPSLLSGTPAENESNFLTDQKHGLQEKQDGMGDIGHLIIYAQ